MKKKDGEERVKELIGGREGGSKLEKEKRGECASKWRSEGWRDVRSRNEIKTREEERKKRRKYEL